LKHTNTHNLPQPLVSAILRDDYERIGHISVTGLIMPPRAYQLIKRHDAEIVEDVSEGLWRFLGNCAHQALEKADTRDHLVEERMTIEVNGWIISGKPDLLGEE